jgi:hypothetical protein
MLELEGYRNETKGLKQQLQHLYRLLQQREREKERERDRERRKKGRHLDFEGTQRTKETDTRVDQKWELWDAEDPFDS